MGCTSAKSGGGDKQTHEPGFDAVLYQNFINENSRNPRDDYRFDFQKPLGEGSFGTVYKVQHRSTQEIRAMKKILKTSLTREEQSKKLVNDILILRQLDHPNILKIYEFYQDADYFYVVSEFCKGGELYDRISAQTHLSEYEAANVIKQVIEVVRYANSQNIAHRDLKPENIMIDQKDSTKGDYDIKIIDWGCSAKYFPGKFMSALVGTPYYIAPEVIEGRYTQLCDIWSIGGILYWMLAGEPCFNGESVEEVLDKVKKSQNWTFKEKVWDSVSEEAKDLIRKMMTHNPGKRMTAEDALNHPWIKKAPSHPISPQVRSECIEKMKKFRAKDQFASAALAYITSQLVAKEDKKDLIKAFKNMDSNGDGTLTIDEIVKYYKEVEMDPDQIKRLVENMDVDGNGRINYTEFVNATIDKRKIMSDTRLKQAFDFFDDDKNGFITADELQKQLGNHLNSKAKSNWQEMMQAADKNRDGKISFDEFKAMMLALN